MAEGRSRWTWWRLTYRHVGCGDTITTDTTLESDLVDCPNDGIVIGADNITLDLNGHTIDGDGRRVDSGPEGEDCDVGMLNRTGYNRLTVVGGTIPSSASASWSMEVHRTLYEEEKWCGGYWCYRLCY